MIDTNLLGFSIIALISTTLLLGFVLGIVIVSYKKLISSYYELQQKHLNQDTTIQNQAQSVLAEARQKAADIIAQAKIIPDEEKQKILDEISALTAVEEKMYQSALEEIKTKSQTILSKMSSDIQSNIMMDYKSMIEEFKRQVGSSNTDLQNAFATKYQQQLDLAQGQLEEYKKAVSTQIDQKAVQILKEFSTTILGKVLTPSDHQDVILKALEEAKKKHVF